MNALPIELDPQRLADFCRKWKIAEFSLFGSVLRQTFRPDSDIDVLVAFTADAHPTLFDLASMQTDLETIFGRAVDLTERDSVESSPNEFRKRSILDSRRVLYAA